MEKSEECTLRLEESLKCLFDYIETPNDPIPGINLSHPR